MTEDPRETGDVESDDGLPVLPGFRQMAVRRREMLDELVDQRRRAGLSQADIARRMGTSQSAVARLESGGVDARLSTLERYATAVGAPIHVRFGPDSPSASPPRATFQRREVTDR
ncbi:MAG: helix-turn-helix domain-containing protein [Micromonosporaceae bacterium]